MSPKRFVAGLPTPHRVGHRTRDFEEEEVGGMLKDELIEPSKAEGSSPIVVLPKRDSKLPFCVYYRGLNAVA